MLIGISLQVITEADCSESDGKVESVSKTIVLNF